MNYKTITLTEGLENCGLILVTADLSKCCLIGMQVPTHRAFSMCSFMLHPHSQVMMTGLQVLRSLVFDILQNKNVPTCGLNIFILFT